MFDFLLDSAFLPFSFALALLFGLLGLELAALMLGGSLMGGNDAGLDGPDLDGPDIDAGFDAGLEADAAVELDAGLDGFDLDGADLDLNGPGEVTDAAGGGLAAWLGFGRMPMLIWLASFLMSFGLGGLALQSALQELFGLHLPAALAALPAGAFALWFTRGFGGVFARLLPQSETAAMSARSLARRRGVITQGTAAAGRPAEVRVTDRFGNSHYLRAEPMRADETLPQGSEVLVLWNRRSGSYALVGLDG